MKKESPQQVEPLPFHERTGVKIGMAGAAFLGVAAITAEIKGMIDGVAQKNAPVVRIDINEASAPSVKERITPFINSLGRGMNTVRSFLSEPEPSLNASAVDLDVVAPSTPVSHTPDWFVPLYAHNQDFTPQVNLVVNPGDPWPSLPTTFIDGIYIVPEPNCGKDGFGYPFLNNSGTWHVPPGRFDMRHLSPEEQRRSIARLNNPNTNQEEVLRFIR